MNLLTRIASVALLGLALVVPVAAVDAGEARVVAGNGTVLEIRGGLAGDLAPGSSIPAEHRLLTLDVLAPGAERDRHIVPGTWGYEEESDVLLLWDDEAAAAFVMYQVQINGLHPIIRLVSYVDGEWGDPVDVVSHPFALKLEPTVFLSQESRPGMEPRTALHLIWAEGDSGRRQTFHAVVILQGGEYLGWAPIQDLSDLAEAVDLPAAGHAPGLFEANGGLDSESVVVGWLDPLAQRVRTAEVRLLPSDLADLADRARLEIIGIGWRSLTPGAVSSKLLALETRLHDGLHQYLAAAVGTMVEAEVVDSEAALEDFANRARLEIIGIGSRVGTGAVEEPAATRLVEIAPESGEPGHHVLKSTLYLDLAAPEDVPETGARLLVAHEPSEVTLAWPEDGRLAFRRGSAAGWSASAFLDLEELGLDLEEGFALLETRLGSL